MEKVYVLYLEMFNEWAIENGGCDVIGVYSSKEKALDKLKTELKNEVDFLKNYIEIDVDTIDDITMEKDYLSVDVYSCEHNKDNEIVDGTYRIDEKNLL